MNEPMTHGDTLRIGLRSTKKEARMVQVQTRKRNDKFSSWKKFAKLEAETKKLPGNGFVSIRAGSKYVSAYEQERRDYISSKRKWTGGSKPFRATFGPASTGINKQGGMMHQSEYRPWLKHSFRDEDPSQFLAANWKSQ